MATLLDIEIEAALARLTPEWLAGFFDGEGSVSASVHNGGNYKNYPRLMVSITQSDFNLLNLIALKFSGNGTMYSPVRKKSPRERRPIWILSFGGKAALPLLRCIQPHVILKRKLVEWAIQTAELTLERGRCDTATEANFAKRYELMEKIRSENSSGFAEGPESKRAVQ
jgi:hypothetical protein